MSDKKRIWIDITNAPHVMVFRPLINVLQSKGHEVTVTARDFSQTLSLLKKNNIAFTEIGQHQGKSILRKMLGLIGRTLRLVRFGIRNKFDLALSHGSNDLAIAAFILRVPHVTMFDYEFAKVAHNINLRTSTKLLIPDVIPSDILYSYGATDKKIDKYPGLKEEYYLFDFKPDHAVLSELGLDEGKLIVVLRTAPDFALYHRLENDIFNEVISFLKDRSGVQVVILPRTQEQREGLKALAGSNFIIPEQAIDAQSLIYFSDLVISAGGTMNREAVVLNTPVYTVFAGKMGAIDLDLIAQKRMIKLVKIEDIDLKKKTVREMPSIKDPALWSEKILKAAKG